MQRLHDRESVTFKPGGTTAAAAGSARGPAPRRRASARLQVGLPVRATLSTGEVVLTKTVDVSASGVLLAHARLGRPMDPVGLRISLPGGRGSFEAVGRIVRVGWTETALRLGPLQAADAAVLKGLVEGVRFSPGQVLADRRAAG
ncbi:MAG: hypothetical protein JWN65_2214 [Solirubrobacterales bacterium]|nr:hypothetical protein [Solirubrobacterales bacterium]